MVILERGLNRAKHLNIINTIILYYYCTYNDISPTYKHNMSSCRYVMEYVIHDMLTLEMLSRMNFKSVKGPRRLFEQKRMTL